MINIRIARENRLGKWFLVRFSSGLGTCGRINFLRSAGFSKFIIWFVRRKYKKIKIGTPVSKIIPKITGLDMYTMR